MRIAIVTPVFPPYGGGMGVVAYQHAKIVAAAGHAVTVLTPDYGRPKPAAAFRVAYVPTRLRYGNAAMLTGLKHRLAGFSVIALHHPFIGAASAVIAARRRSVCRLVLHYHMDLLAPGWRGLVLRGWQAWSVPRLLGAADHVTVASRDYAQHGLLAPWLRRREELFTELPNGVDAEFFSPGAKPAALAAQRRVAGKRVVLFVGGMDAAHYFKGVPVLLQALARLPADVHAVLVGSGNRSAGYQQLAARLGVGERVSFAGAVVDAELPDYYRLADVVVLPAVTRSEAFGLALLEAMACGRPTIATNLPGVRTVVADGVTGFLATPGSADDVAEKILRGLGNPAQAESFGRAGRQKVVATYAWSVIGSRLLALYDALAKSMV